MVAAMGVSRTVVREAVAALRAEGLVTTRQGVGAFVSDDAGRRPFRLALGGLPSIAEALDIMELRQSVEVEAAGLAAARALASARREIAAALTAIDLAIARGESAVDEDFAFHRAIAAATGNPQFPHFLEYLGHYIIPRQSIRVAAHRAEGQRAYLEMIQGEHRAICAAIRDKGCGRGERGYASPPCQQPRALPPPRRSGRRKRQPALINRVSWRATRTPAAGSDGRQAGGKAARRPGPSSESAATARSRARGRSRDEARSPAMPR